MRSKASSSLDLHCVGILIVRTSRRSQLIVKEGEAHLQQLKKFRNKNSEPLINDNRS